MIIATDPIIAITVPASVDLATKLDILVTFKQQNSKLNPEQCEVVLTKALSAAGVTVINPQLLHVALNQAETLRFRPGKNLLIQVNWLNSDGSREATKTATMFVDDNLIPRVIEVVS